MPNYTIKRINPNLFPRCSKHSPFFTMSFGAMVHEPCPVKYSRRVAQETGMKTRVGAQFGNASRISRFGHHGPDTPTMAFPSCPSSRPGVPAPDATLGPRFPNPDPHESHAPILRLGSAQSVGERPRPAEGAFLLAPGTGHGGSQRKTEALFRSL